MGVEFGVGAEFAQVTPDSKLVAVEGIVERYSKLRSACSTKMSSANDHWWCRPCKFFDNNGSVKEYGVCQSHEREPTVQSPRSRRPVAQHWMDGILAVRSVI